MQKNNPTNFSATELDRLLNRSFLESHLTKPKYEKITEVIAAHTIGISPVAIPAQQSFIKKLIRKKSVQLLLIGSIISVGGVAGIIFLNNHSEEPRKINAAPSPVHLQTMEESNTKKDLRQKSISSRNNPATSREDMYKISAMKNTNSTEITYNDSITNNLTIQQMEPMYVEDPAILLPTDKDSISVNSKIIYNDSIRNDTIKKRRTKGKRRKHDFKYTIDNLK